MRSAVRASAMRRKAALVGRIAPAFRDPGDFVHLLPGAVRDADQGEDDGREYLAFVKLFGQGPIEVVTGLAQDNARARWQVQHADEQSDGHRDVDARVGATGLEEVDLPIVRAQHNEPRAGTREEGHQMPRLRLVHLRYPRRRSPARQSEAAAGRSLTMTSWEPNEKGKTISISWTLVVQRIDTEQIPL